MTVEENSDDLNAVAIIGMAGRFPGAKNTGEFWRSICSGAESIKVFRDEELDRCIDEETTKDPDYVKARGIIQDPDKFDSSFFAMTPREAEIMDPQQRVFLESSWEALEDAGYDPGAFDGLIGVFGGTGFNTYLINNVLANQKLYKSVGEHQVMFANAPDYLSPRVSYKLNLKGPSVSIYTGCSTSLVAVAYAFDSLLSYQCDIALAGGVYVWCPQNSGYLYKEGEIFSIDGHCRPFDASASGTVFSNGVGVAALKRLNEAIEDNDHIYAVIRGVAVNNDGAQKTSFAAPSVEGQAEVIAMAIANAEVSPETINYVEAHGTGTKIGDPIEVEALTQAFRSKTEATGFCAIGSLKGNVGHMDAAAGIAGLIKTSLALKNKVIPPSINFEEANPEIDFENSPFFVNTQLRDWPQGSTRRRAGLTSLGVGGTNAHVVLEEAPERSVSGPSRPKQLLLLSAKTEQALDASAANLSKYFSENPSLNIADVAYTLQTGRKGFGIKCFTVCEDSTDAVQSLNALSTHQKRKHHAGPMPPEVVFMFPGQGTQYVNMGLNLYQYESVFRETLDHCAEILKTPLDMDLRDILYPGGGNEEEAQNLLRKTGFQQPALFAIEYALARLWESWGVKPSAMIGHSIGEYVAACLAGVFPFEDALRLVAARGRMMQEQPGGAMLSVRQPVEQLAPRLYGNISLAAVNAPSLCVISGPSDAVEAFQGVLENEGVICRFLHTSHAFHSPMMDPIVEPFTNYVRKVELSKPTIPFISTVTGTWITPDEATDPEYWGRQLRQPVRFADGISTLWEWPERILLEVGPRTTSTTLARQQAKDPKKKIAIPSLGDSADNNGEWVTILNAVGNLWLNGATLDWRAFYKEERRHRIPLPTYPFERKQYWIESPKEQGFSDARASAADTGNVSQELPGAPQDGSMVPENSEPDANYIPPRNEVEHKVLRIWNELLGIEQIGIHDDFFELGGDSLTASNLLVHVEKTFNKKLPPSLLYETRTVAKLSEILSDISNFQAVNNKAKVPYKVITGSLPEDKQEIIELWKKNFPDLPEERYEWIYEGNPIGAPICLFVKDTRQNIIVGVQALFPRRIFVNGKPYMAGLGGDLAINKEHRVLAPALMLHEAIFSLCDRGKLDFYYGFPNDKARSINQISEVQMLDVFRMTKPLKSYRYLKRYFRDSGISKLFSVPLDLAARQFSKENRHKVYNGYLTELQKNFDERVDRLWQKILPRFEIIGERSSSYLNWRYFHSPHYEHFVFVLLEKVNKDILGYIVFHKSEENDVKIDDMLCCDMEETLDALMSEFLLFQRRKGAETVSISFTGSQLFINKFREFGFSIRDKEGKVSVYAPSDSLLHSFIKEREKWYLMPGDNDI